MRLNRPGWKRARSARRPALNEALCAYGTAPLQSGARLADLLRRPELDYDKLAPFDPDRPALSAGVKQTVEVSIKYDGYIKRQLAEVEKFSRLEGKKLPADADYMNIEGIRLEARQKLNQIKPENIGQASRISGVSPADISVRCYGWGISDERFCRLYGTGVKAKWARAFYA